MGTLNAKIGAVYNKHVFWSVSAHAPASSSPSLRAPAAKGRTNVELREQFTLADGVSQSMGTFKSKSPAKSPTSSAASTWSGYSSSSASGPIVKVSASGSLLDYLIQARRRRGDSCCTCICSIVLITVKQVQCCVF